MTRLVLIESVRQTTICGLVLAGLFAGCNGKSGSSSASGDDASGGAGAGASGGTASGGSAAVVAGAGGASSLSACRAEPDLTPSLPAPTALDPDLVARAAALLGSCLPDDGVQRNAAHLWLEHLSASGVVAGFGMQLDCLANAACGCDAVEHCLGITYRLPPAVCTSSCEGGVLTSCGDGPQVTIDCARLGLSCDPEAACVAETPVACVAADAPSCTAQGEVKSCDRGFMHKTPCESLGFSCVAGKCVGEGAACTDTSDGFDEVLQPIGTGCLGSTLQACVGGRTTTLDCATQGPGFGCQALDGSFFCGLAAECMPADDFGEPNSATCDGTVLSFCSAGRLEHLDCTTLGFTGCDIDTKIGHYGCTPIIDLK